MTSFQDTPTKLIFLVDKNLCYNYTCEASLSSRDSSEGVELSCPLLITVLSCTTMPAAPPASLPPFLSSSFSFLLLSKYSSAFAIASELVWESEDVRPFTRSPWKEGKQRNLSQPNTSGLVDWLQPLQVALQGIPLSRSQTTTYLPISSTFARKSASSFLSFTFLFASSSSSILSRNTVYTEVKNLHARRGSRKCLFTT